MASVIENKALEVADKIAEKMGYFAVGAEYLKENQNKILRIYVDKDGGIGVDECEAFSREFEEAFDKSDIIDEAYILEISSPGVDRVLKTQREFEYYSGRKVEAKMYKAYDGKKEFCGILKSFDGDNAIISVDDKDITVNINEAVYIRLYFEI